MFEEMTLPSCTQTNDMLSTIDADTRTEKEALPLYAAAETERSRTEPEFFDAQALFRQQFVTLRPRTRLT